MASKRSSHIDYAEESCTDEEDDMLVDQESQDYLHHKENTDRPRPGRPRKSSLTPTSSMDGTNTTTGPRRRGRGPSKRPCLNRNALMARENRQRKKEYMERIESKLQFFQNENQDLNNTIQKQNNEIKRLTNEVAYLKTVLNNNTMITSLLKAMNDSLKRMHGEELENNSNLPKTSPDVLNWVNGQTNSSKTNNLSMPFSGSMTTKTTTATTPLSRPNVENTRLNYGQTQQPLQKIARKTMPFTSSYVLPKSENPPSVESLLDDDDKKLLHKSSSESPSYCEYMTDKSSIGPAPTTPMSMNSMDKGEASLSNTDFSQLSSFNVDLFDNFDEVANPLQFEQDQPDLFNEDTLFHSLEKDAGLKFDPLETSKLSECLNEKALMNNNAGVCLHINSTRVSLEFCSICHLNSLNSEVA